MSIFIFRNVAFIGFCHSGHSTVGPQLFILHESSSSGSSHHSQVILSFLFYRTVLIDESFLYVFFIYSFYLGTKSSATAFLCTPFCVVSCMSEFNIKFLIRRMAIVRLFVSVVMRGMGIRVLKDFVFNLIGFSLLLLRLFINSV